ncbi:MAG: hypothetical protein ACHQIL_08375 [Steroidobacterales bacterium]
MKATRQLAVSAPFDIEDCGNGLWCVRRRQPPMVAVYLRGFSPPAQLAECTGLRVDWADGGGADVCIALPAQSVTVRVAGAFAHEPRGQLYGTLGLPAFGAPAQRFWRTVFGIVRLPGGRWLLSWLAPRRR